jgi:hypothetical protein
MRIFYKSLFRNWVEITGEQKVSLIEHMEKGITALSGIKKQDYINGRFIIK